MCVNVFLVDIFSCFFQSLPSVTEQALPVSTSVLATVKAC